MYTDVMPLDGLIAVVITSAGREGREKTVRNILSLSAAGRVIVSTPLFTIEDVMVVVRS